MFITTLKPYSIYGPMKNKNTNSLNASEKLSRIIRCLV